SLRLFLPFIAFGCLLVTGAGAQGVSSGLSIAGGHVSLPRNAARWLDSFANKSPGSALVLMQLDAVPAAEDRARLSRQGITLRSSVADRTFIATINRSKVALQ